MLDAVEEITSPKLEGINVGTIEWYHHLRNELYHQGFGLTIAGEKVEIYAELAQILIKNLPGETVTLSANSKATLLGTFLEAWDRLDNSLTALGLNTVCKNTRPRQFLPPNFISPTRVAAFEASRAS